MQTARTELVNRVVTCFRDMGASNDQLEVERKRLAADDHYLEDWVQTTYSAKKSGKKSVWKGLLDLLLLKV